MTEHSKEITDKMDLYIREIAEMYGAALAAEGICPACISKGIIASVVAMSIANGILPPVEAAKASALGIENGRALFYNSEEKIEGVTRFEFPVGRMN